MVRLRVAHADEASQGSGLTTPPASLPRERETIMAFDDALRGYAFPVHQRDVFVCQYCGLDGTKSFDSWLSLSWDHLLPKGHPDRDNLEYIVTACFFCNVADNQYFRRAQERGLRFDGMTREALV